MNSFAETQTRPDEQLEMVADATRRRLLFALLNGATLGDDPVTIDLDDTVDMETIVELNHVHLPKLSNHGFVYWDRENDQVSKGPQFDEIEPLLIVLHEHADELPGDWL